MIGRGPPPEVITDFTVRGLPSWLARFITAYCQLVFYAEAEQVVGQTNPDVLALEFESGRIDLEETIDSPGIQAAIWNEIEPSTPFYFPDKRKLTTVCYHSLRPPIAYVEPMSVENIVPSMPLFLDDAHYVNTPLNETYVAALSAIPQYVRRQLAQ